MPSSPTLPLPRRRAPRRAASGRRSTAPAAASLACRAGTNRRASSMIVWRPCTSGSASRRASETSRPLRFSITKAVIAASTAPSGDQGPAQVGGEDGCQVSAGALTDDLDGDGVAVGEVLVERADRDAGQRRDPRRRARSPSVLPQNANGRLDDGIHRHGRAGLRGLLARFQGGRHGVAPMRMDGRQPGFHFQWTSAGVERNDRHPSRHRSHVGHRPRTRAPSARRARDPRHRRCPPARGSVGCSASVADRGSPGHPAARSLPRSPRR